MDIYGMSSAGPDAFGVDDLFDFSGNNLFNNNITSSTDSATQFQYNSNNNNFTACHEYSTDFIDHFSVPNDDIAELEWLSKFVDDSAINFPANNIAGTINFRPENTSCHSKSRSKRTKAPENNNGWTSTPQKEVYTSSTSSSETTSEGGGVRRCTHCASEKTPQWRTGPLGPKTLCNACGVRYQSGRLVPEYRPAASPSFVLTQHSNSHRKVMELRRQKEMMSCKYQQQEVVSSEHQIYAGRRNHRHQQLHLGSNYEIC